MEIGATASNSGRAPKASEKRQSTADRSVRRRLADGGAGVAGLPEETRGALTSLMVRLILEHAQANGAVWRTEAGDDLTRSALTIWSARRCSTCGNPRPIRSCTTARAALQYAMRDRLTALGWSEIEVIDDDLGRSAAGGVQRAGFERMVAEVCLGKVGAVCAREVSRFARNSRDWQLIEMCRVVDTVLVDQETIYAPGTAMIGCCWD